MGLLINAKFNVHGSLCITKRNVVTNIEKHYEAHNLCLPSFNRILAYASYGYTSSGTRYCVLDKMHLQVGSGSSEPTSQDTALTNLLWTITSHNTACSISQDGSTIIATLTYVIPASSDYVGTIREVGLRYAFPYRNMATTQYKYALATHSLLKDSESIPYEISKTSLDNITVTYTLFITCPGSNMPAAAWVSHTVNDIIAVSADYQCGCTIYAMYCKSKVIDLGTRILRKRLRGHSYAAIAGSGYYGYPANYFNTTNIVTIAVDRLALNSSYNGHYIFTLGIIPSFLYTSGSSAADQPHANGSTYIEDEPYREQPLFEYNFPDTSLFPVTTLSNYVVGTGDGVQDDFTPPIPLWLENTEEIFIDGVQQTRNVDYTCDYQHNLQKNLELTPLFQGAIIEGELSLQEPFIDTIYLTDASVIHAADRIDQPHTLRSVSYNKANPVSGTLLKMNGSHPFIIELSDAVSKDVDKIYLWTFYNPTYQSERDSVTIEVSDDKVNWTPVLTNVSGCPYSHNRGNSDTLPTSSALNVGWAEYVLQSTISMKYWKVSVNMTVYSTSNITNHKRFGMVLMRNGQPLHFNTPPAAGSAITMNCDINIPYKDNQHVFDASATITV